MKKLLAGCLVVLALGMVATAVGAYFLWRAAQPAIEGARQIADGAARLGEVAQEEQRLIDTEPYDGPANGELTPDQVARFLRVQAHVKQTLGDRAEAFREKYKDLATTRPDGTEVPPSLPRLLTGLGEMSQIYLAGRRAQVDALNREGFSRAEFTWVRLRVYQAAGAEATRYDARELEAAIESLATGARVTPPEVRLPDAPPRNRELVKPHAAQLMEWLTMASFGL
jgi:hypothetical protein